MLKKKELYSVVRFSKDKDHMKKNIFHGEWSIYLQGIMKIVFSQCDWVDNNCQDYKLIGNHPKQYVYWHMAKIAGTEAMDPELQLEEYSKSSFYSLF